MFSLISKGISTIKYDGIQVFLIRIIKYFFFKLHRLFQKKDRENLEKWSAIKNKYKGKRVFVIGNGPSLNKTPLFLLKDEYTMSFNRFNLFFERLDWKPTFYMVVDDLVVKDMHNEINSSIIPVIDYCFFPDVHPSYVKFNNLINKNKNVYWVYSDKPEFTNNLPQCGINKTVVNASLQILAYLGFTEIYLLGVDMSFIQHKINKNNSRNWVSQDADPNHFDPRYFGKGRKYHNPTTEEMIEKFEIGRKFFDKLNVKIYNAGYDSKLEVFPKVDFMEILKISPEKEFDLLVHSFNLTGNPQSLSEAFPQAKYINNVEEFDKNDEIIIAPLEIANILIFNNILSHIPFGPYKNNYIFRQRTA